MITLTLDDKTAHAFIRALEDAGCYTYAGMVRDAAKCDAPTCISEHN